MKKEEIIQSHLNCNCNSYSQDACFMCKYNDEIRGIMEEYSQQQNKELQSQLDIYKLIAETNKSEVEFMDKQVKELKEENEKLKESILQYQLHIQSLTK